MTLKKILISAYIALVTVTALSGCANTTTTAIAATTRVPVTTTTAITTPVTTTTTAVTTTTTAVTTPVTTTTSVTTAGNVDTDDELFDYIYNKYSYLFSDSEENITTTSKPAETTKPVTTSKPAETTKPVTTSKPAETTKPITTSKPAETTKPVELNSIDAISDICGLKANVETDLYACFVDTEKDHNPYDVEWNYGKDYNAFVNACDWSLVFDAKYYAETFPMLATLYHNDEALLLEHFQTVGVHEGRQGSAKFNVMAYASNADSELSKVFGNNYEGYYFYYMLNYDSEKNVNCTKHSDNKALKKQYCLKLTALQAQEYDRVHYYRDEVNANTLISDSEMMAFANYRAYLNAHDGWRAHEWAQINNSLNFYNAMDVLAAAGLGENTKTCTKYAPYLAYNYTQPSADAYRISTSGHYESMINTNFRFFGTSNNYIGTGILSSFDVFTKNLSTAHNP